jgi:hypothetical protein
VNPKTLPIRFACAALLGAFLLSFASCASTNGPAKWVEATVDSPNQTVLMQVTAYSLQKVGFPISSGFEQGKLTAVTGWDIELAPFKGEGFRERCHIEFKPLTGKKYALRVRVEREINDDIAHPLDISYAEWKPDPDNDARARLVVGQIKGRLGPEFKTTANETAQNEPKQ